MNPVKKLRQIQINHRPKALFQIFSRFSNCRMSTTITTEPMTAGMEGWFKYRLQNLENRLLNHPRSHIGNAQTALTSAGFGNPDPTNIPWVKAFRQQYTAQFSQQTRSLRFGLLNRLAVDPRCPLIAYNGQ